MSAPTPLAQLLTPNEHWSEVRRIAREEANRSKIRLATVAAISGGMAAVRKQGAASNGEALLSRVGGSTIAVGDTVYIADTVGGETIILGPVTPGSRSEFRFDNNQIPWLTWRGGRFYSLAAMFPLGPMVGMPLTANRIYYIPIYYPGDEEIASGAFEITTAGTSGSMAMMGWYECTAGGIPGALVASTGKTAQWSVAVKTLGFSPTFLPPMQRWYFVALVHESTPSIRGYTGTEIPSLVGGSSTSLDPVCMFREDIGSGWTALPDVASPSTHTTNTYLDIGVIAA